MTELSRHMAGVAKCLLGEPNKALSTPKELRFGNRGSLSIDLEKGTWFDHEAGNGGGVLDLIQRETGFANGAALDWLRAEGFEVEERQQHSQRRMVATYPYHDEGGKLLFEVCRFEPKDFRQRAPDGMGGWRWSLSGVRRVLYRLPALVAAPDALVFLVEGEKDADRLAASGLIATTCPGGANKWRGEYAEALKGRNVVVLPDNDPAGAGHAETIRAGLTGPADRVVVLALPGLPDKGDVSDWMDAGGTAERLSEMARAALESAEHEGPDPAPWPDPDMSLVSAERRDPPPFPAEVFGPWSEWIATAAECKGAPPDYIGHALLTVGGSLIGNARWAAPQPGWSEPPIMFSALIGDPSSGKSPAMDAVLDPLRELEAELAHGYRDRLREHEDAADIASVAESAWKESVKAAIKEGDDAPDRPPAARSPDEPIRPRLNFSDATPEKVAEILESLWRSLLLRRDELSGWLGNMNKYSGGGDRAFWLECYGGRSYTVERVKRAEPVIVDRLSVAILGTIQPDRMHTLLMNGDDDGLLARLTVTWPEPAPIRRPRVNIDEALAKRAFARLHGLPPAYDEDGKPRPWFVPFDEVAVDLLYEFRDTCRAMEASAEGLMKSHIGKFPGLAIRLALILAYLDWAMNGDGAEPEGITANEMGRACHYVAEYLYPMAMRAYGDAAAPAEERGAIKLAKRILNGGWSEFTTRDVQREKRDGLRSKAEIDPALTVLVQAGWLRSQTEKTGGRPRHLYQVNPAVHGEGV